MINFRCWHSDCKGSFVEHDQRTIMISSACLHLAMWVHTFPLRRYSQTGSENTVKTNIFVWTHVCLACLKNFKLPELEKTSSINLMPSTITSSFLCLNLSQLRELLYYTVDSQDIQVHKNLCFTADWVIRDFQFTISICLTGLHMAECFHAAL